MHIGLTGNIATGKSVVYRALCERENVVGFDADAVVHQLYSTDEVRDQLVSAFSSAILNESGMVDRKEVRRLFLECEGVKETLENVFHPLVHARYLKVASSLEPGQCLLADIPLLFEKSTPYEFDTIITVACSSEVQLKRLMERSKLDKKEAMAMIKKQVALSYKMRHSNHVLWNNGSLDLLQRQLNLLVHHIF